MTIFAEADGWRDLADEGPIYFLKDKGSYEVAQHDYRKPFYVHGPGCGRAGKKFNTWEEAKKFVDDKVSSEN